MIKTQFSNDAEIIEHLIKNPTAFDEALSVDAVEDDENYRRFILSFIELARTSDNSNHYYSILGEFIANTVMAYGERVAIDESSWVINGERS